MERKQIWLPILPDRTFAARERRIQTRTGRGSSSSSIFRATKGFLKKASRAACRKGLMLLSLIILSAIAAPGSRAQDSATASAMSSIAASGFVDLYYSKNFAAPASMQNKFRNFDINENQFTLSLAEIVFQKNAQPIGFRIDLDFGAANDVVQTGVAGTLANVQQAYASALLPIGNGLTVDVGKFVTFMGYELIESKDNWNYSRSLLFSWAIPYFHVGARASYPVSPELTLLAHVVNGWNNVVDNNGSKTIGATVNYAVLPTTSLILNWIGGREQPAGPTDVGSKDVFDFTVTHQLTDDFALALNADYGQEKIASGTPLWKGAALYARYALDAASAVALRAEVFSDPDGYALGTGIPQDMKEFTATYEYKFTDALLVRGELRNDFSNVPMFDNGAKSNADKNQLTFLVGLVAIF
jgi:hypothetical protein